MRILIAVDGSQTSLEAVRYAGRLASELKSPALTLLYVRPSHTGGLVNIGAPGLLSESRLENEVGEIEREVLAEACSVLQQHELPAEQLVETGNAGQAICRVAADGEFDLVVLGSRGRGELKTLLLGSTSAAVVHGAPCPVLVVK